LYILLTSVALASTGYGQGFIYDQQSADETTGGGAVVAIQSNQPLGQSFTPTLSSVGFIRLNSGDSTFNSLGATLYVNLRADSITGTILGSTSPVFMPDGFSGYTNFIFSIPVAVTPGTTYYFQPVVQSGDTWGIVGYGYGYAGGVGFSQGLPLPGSDLWFREGILVPEPSTFCLWLVGGAVFVIHRARRR